MISSYIPTDLFKYKSRLVAGLTLSQLISGAIGVVATIVTTTHLIHVDMNPTLKTVLCGAPFLAIVGIGTAHIFGQPLYKMIYPYLYHNLLTPVYLYKEVHHDTLEEYEKVYSFEEKRLEKYKTLPEKEETEALSEEEAADSKKKKPIKKKKEKIPRPVTKCKPSKTYIPIP